MYICVCQFQGYCGVYHRTLATCEAHCAKLNAQVKPPAYLTFTPRKVGE